MEKSTNERYPVTVDAIIAPYGTSAVDSTASDTRITNGIVGAPRPKRNWKTTKRGPFDELLVFVSTMVFECEMNEHTMPRSDMAKIASQAAVASFSSFNSAFRSVKELIFLLY